MFCSNGESLLVVFLAIGAGVGLLGLWREVLWRSVAGLKGLYLNLFLATTLFLSLFWGMGFRTDFGLTLHFLGMSFAVLFIGADLALIAGTLALLAQMPFTDYSAFSFAVAFLSAVLVPVLLMKGLIRWELRRRSRNFFVYIMLNGFLGGMVTVVAAVVVALGLCFLFGSEAWSSDHELIFAYLPLIALPEGILNGMLVTGFLVFQPEWVRTLYESRYERRG